MSANIIQSIIDENKENLTDELYLKLSNAMLTVHNEEQSFYEAVVIVPRFIPTKGGSVRYESHLRTVIIRMKTTIADTYIQDLNDSGTVQMCTHIFEGTIDDKYDIYDTDTDFVSLDDDDEITEFNMIRCDMPAVTCVRLSKI